MDDFAAACEHIEKMEEQQFQNDLNGVRDPDDVTAKEWDQMEGLD